MEVVAGQTCHHLEAPARGSAAHRRAAGSAAVAEEALHQVVEVAVLRVEALRVIQGLDPGGAPTGVPALGVLLSRSLHLERRMSLGG